MLITQNGTQDLTCEHKFPTVGLVTINTQL